MIASVAPSGRGEPPAFREPPQESPRDGRHPGSTGPPRRARLGLTRTPSRCPQNSQTDFLALANASMQGLFPLAGQLSGSLQVRATSRALATPAASARSPLASSAAPATSRARSPLLRLAPRLSPAATHMLRQRPRSLSRRKRCDFHLASLPSPRAAQARFSGGTLPPYSDGSASPAAAQLDGLAAPLLQVAPLAEFSGGVLADLSADPAAAAALAAALDLGGAVCSDVLQLVRSGSLLRSDCSRVPPSAPKQTD